MLEQTLLHVLPALAEKYLALLASKSRVAKLCMIGHHTILTQLSSGFRKSAFISASNAVKLLYLGNLRHIVHQQWF